MGRADRVVCGRGGDSKGIDACAIEPLRSGLVRIPGLHAVAVCCLLLILGGCAADSAAPDAEEGVAASESPSESADTFDPLEFEEPELPGIPNTEPTATQMLKALNFIPRAYTWGLRTGFSSAEFRALGCGCGLPEEVDALASEGLRAVTDPVRMRVLQRSELIQLDQDLWSISVRAQFQRPAASIEDDQGQQVRRTPARTWVANVTWNVITGVGGRWFVMDWQEA
ncbi:hypothetical protein GCM10023339_40690 [Alloalcanivorax gelatiniphagus]